MIYNTFEMHQEGSLPGAHLVTYIQEYSDAMAINDRPLILLCPGGGYTRTSDREAEPMALKFLAMGYHAAVLRYSCAPAEYPTSLKELAYSIKFLREHADQNDRFYVIGQVGYRALFRKDPRLVEDFHYGATAPTLQRARDITVDAIDDFKSGKLDEIYIVYTKIQNALTSEPVMERLLPLDRAHLTPAPKGLGDPRGEVELVPDAWTVFEQTAPIYMHGMIFGAMTESFCAEQSARMTAMDSATKSANDMIRDLQLEYNRTRQGSITQEITEIIGGAAAVQNNE